MDYVSTLENNLEAVNNIQSDTMPSLYRIFHKTSVKAKLMDMYGFTESKYPRVITTGGKRYYTLPTRMMIKLYGSTEESWQSCKIFLVMCGLLERIIPSSKSKIDVFKAEYRRAMESGQRPTCFYVIPSYTPSKLQQAERIAKQIAEGGISISHITKTDVIRVFGECVANRVYRDRRRIPSTETWMRDEIIKLMRAELDEQGFATWDEIERIMKRRIYRRSNRDKLRKMLAKCLQRKKSIIIESGLEYHQPTKQEREQYHLKTGTWIITESRGTNNDNMQHET